MIWTICWWKSCNFVRYFFLFISFDLVYLLEPNLSSRLSALYVLGCHQRWSSCFSSQAPTSQPARAFYYYNKREAGHLELWSMEEGLPTANLVHLLASKQEGIYERDSIARCRQPSHSSSSPRYSGVFHSSTLDIDLTWAVIIIIIRFLPGFITQLLTIITQAFFQHLVALLMIPLAWWQQDGSIRLCYVVSSHGHIRLNPFHRWSYLRGAWRLFSSSFS